MSIKIYAGYIIKKGTNLFEFQRFVTETFNNLIKDDMRKEMVAKLTTIYDLIANNKHPELKEYDFFNALKEAKKDIDKSEEVAGIDELNVVLYHNPIRDEYYAYFLGLPKYEKEFEKLPQVKEFSYWNNSDRPDNLTEEQWKDRLKAWEETIDLGESLMSQGLTISTSRYNLLKYQATSDIIAGKNFKIPTRKKREKQYGYWVAYKEEAKFVDKNEELIEDIFEEIRRVKSEEVQNRILKNVKIDTLTIKTLIGKE